MEDQNYKANEAQKIALKQEIERLRNLLRNEQKSHESAQKKVRQYQMAIEEIVKAVLQI
jgi:hypothetical protein